MDNSELTNLPVNEKLKLVTQLWDEIAASNEPVVLSAEVIEEIQKRAAEVEADPSILIDEEEMWRRVDGR